MRRRSTYITDPSDDVNPADIQVKKQQLNLAGLHAAREERLTFGLNDLPIELQEVLRNSHELHIRWAAERSYDFTKPFLSRISPGLHVHYTPLANSNDSLLCPTLKNIFASDLKCQSPSISFIRAPVFSERFASTATLQYYSLLPSLTNVVRYIKRDICSRSDLSCTHTASLLNIADTFDIDYDSISHALTLSTYWSDPPEVYYDPVGEWTTYNAWNLDVQQTSQQDRIEVGILSSTPAVHPHELQLSGFLTVVGEDNQPKSTLFSFPSRHHIPSPAQRKAQQYTVSFQQPQGLHPTMQISFPSASALTPPSNRPEDSHCALQAYITMPSYIFVDEYAFLGNDPLFQQAHKIRATKSIAGERDLEAPDYVVDKWGSTLLVEPAIPSSYYSPPSSSSSHANKEDEAWNITVPMHLRYLPPTPGGISIVDFPWPILYWACTAEEGTKFPVNPFDRIHLGFEGLYGPRTMFYHLEPNLSLSRSSASAADGRLIEKLRIPVYDTESMTLGGKVKSVAAVEWGTVLVVICGFLWVVRQLWPALRSAVDENFVSAVPGPGSKEVTNVQQKDAKKE